jgi:hypothetical protein
VTTEDDMKKATLGILASTLLVLAAGVAHAGWFGPSKDEVSVKLEPPVKKCEQNLPWGMSGPQLKLSAAATV